MELVTMLQTRISQILKNSYPYSGVLDSNFVMQKLLTK